MDIRLNEEQQMMQQTFAELFGSRFTNADARLVEHDQGIDVDGQPQRGWRPELWQQLVDIGVAQATIPEDAGGVGIGQVAAAVIAEQMGRVGFQSPFADTLLAADLIVQEGRAGSHWTLLERLASGSTVAAAIRDHGRANPALLDGLEVAARVDGDGWKVSGQKRFVPFARHVDYLLLALATAAGPTLFLIPRQRRGVTVRRSDDLGRGELCVVELQATPLAAGDVVGAVGEAQAPFARALTRTRVRHTAYLVGLCQGALDMTLAYTRQRQQFGQSISSFQTISFRLAALTARTEALRWLAYRLAWEADQEREPRRLAASSLAMAADLGRELTAECIQIHGAYGYCEESDIQRLYRRAAVDAMLWGTPTQLRDEALKLLAAEDNGYSWRGAALVPPPPVTAPAADPAPAAASHLVSAEEPAEQLT